MSENPHLDNALKDLTVKIWVRMQTDLLGKLLDFKTAVDALAEGTADRRRGEVRDLADRLIQRVVLGEDSPRIPCDERRTDGPGPGSQ